MLQIVKLSTKVVVKIGQGTHTEMAVTVTGYIMYFENSSIFLEIQLYLSGL